MSENWKPIAGYEGKYEISDLGRVKSLVRHGDTNSRILKPVLRKSGHLQVSLSGKTRKVHQLVAVAFLGPCPDGMEICHKDGNPANNHASNLKYGTRADNARDRVDHGRDRNARKTHCDNGHEFTNSNTIVRKSGGRDCRACQRGRVRNTGSKWQAFHNMRGS